jgi:hypothetical protein
MGSRSSIVSICLALAVLIAIAVGSRYVWRNQFPKWIDAAQKKSTQEWKNVDPPTNFPNLDSKSVMDGIQGGLYTPPPNQPSGGGKRRGK